MLYAVLLAVLDGETVVRFPIPFLDDGSGGNPVFSFSPRRVENERGIETARKKHADGAVVGQVAYRGIEIPSERFVRFLFGPLPALSERQSEEGGFSGFRKTPVFHYESPRSSKFEGQYRTEQRLVGRRRFKNGAFEKRLAVGDDRDSQTLENPNDGFLVGRYHEPPFHEGVICRLDAQRVPCDRHFGRFRIDPQTREPVREFVLRKEWVPRIRPSVRPVSENESLRRGFDDAVEKQRSQRKFLRSGSDPAEARLDLFAVFPMNGRKKGETLHGSWMCGKLRAFYRNRRGNPSAKIRRI